MLNNLHVANNNTTNYTDINMISLLGLWVVGICRRLACSDLEPLRSTCGGPPPTSSYWDLMVRGCLRPPATENPRLSASSDFGPQRSSPEWPPLTLVVKIRRHGGTFVINPSALSISLTLPPFTDRVGWWRWLGPIAEDVTAAKEEAPAFPFHRGDAGLVKILHIISTKKTHLWRSVIWENRNPKENVLL